MKFIFKLKSGECDECDYAFIDITRDIAVELVEQVELCKKLGATEICYPDPPIVFFAGEYLSKYQMGDVIELLEKSESSWCRPDSKLEFPFDTIGALVPAWVEVVISKYGIVWKAGEKHTDYTYTTRRLNVKHLVEARDKLIEEAKKSSKLILVHLVALTRVCWSDYIRVPSTMTQEEADELARGVAHDIVDGGDYASDPDFWKKSGDCHADIDPDGTEGTEASYTLLPNGNLTKGDVR